MSLPRWLLGLGLCSCALDERQVAVNGACTRAPENGLLTDFSDALVRDCPAGYCAKDFVYQPSVELDGAMPGLLFPYASPDLPPMLLGVVPPSEDVADSSEQLWAAINSGPSTGDVASGFALRFLDCIDTSRFRAVSFTTDITNGDLGDCPLRVAAQFVNGDAFTYSEVRTLESAPESGAVPVTVGSITLPFEQRPDSTALAGLQWEFTIPGGDPAGCSAYFTLDDLKLVR